MAQLVVGSPGKDTLTGGTLNDTLVAARGQMTMTGGGGADTFVIGQGRINATITDFHWAWTNCNSTMLASPGTTMFRSGRITATSFSRSAMTTSCCRASICTNCIRMISVTCLFN